MSSNTQNLIITHKNYYHILGITSEVTAKEISKSFKKLALKWHPDRHSEYQKSFAHRKFLEIMEAYEVLGHPARRRKYDAYRAHKRTRPRATTSYNSTNTQTFKKDDMRYQRARREAASRRSRRTTSENLKKGPRFEDELKKWKKAADKHSRKLAKKSFMHFAGTIDSISKLVMRGIFSTIDVISGNGEYKKALRTCEQKLVEAPKDGDSHYQMGFVYHKKGIYDEALKYYLQAIKLSPANADLFCNLGRLREEQNQYSRAISCYERAVELQPSYTPVYTYLGILHLKMNNYTEAKRCMDTLIGMNRNDLAKQIERAYNS